MSFSKRPLTVEQATNRAAALCARCEQAPADINNKLKKWGLSAKDATGVTRQLIDGGFLNEQRFARAFIKDRFSFNGWGRIKIAHQLRQKGIAGNIIDEAMSVIDEGQYRQRLIELLQAKWRTVKDREPRAAWAAMMRFAASRGFETHLACDCVKQVSHLDAEDD